ncbi:E3 SUMO-protein ligase pli1 [Bonamia ostreae]|uniref:E3 SUMO-protein ligase pli1 n=1 Tax=Bonamia ostreae TaxID=126728 RepID=A0ABV2AQC1_9EUKA
MFQIMRSQDQTRSRTFVLKLFSIKSKSPVNWLNFQASIYINNNFFELDMIELMKSKNKNTLNITKELLKNETNKRKTEIGIKIRTRSLQRVVCVLEITRKLNIEEMVYKTLDEKLSDDDFFQKYANFRICEICSEKSLYRCSKCKSSWYCGILHQKLNWPMHQYLCKSSDSKKTKCEEKIFDDDFNVISNTVSLKCPLTMKKIKIPAKSTNCEHLCCFDLENLFNLNFGSTDLICPICTKRLKPKVFSFIVIFTNLIKDDICG